MVITSYKDSILYNYNQKEIERNIRNLWQIRNHYYDNRVDSDMYIYILRN